MTGLKFQDQMDEKTKNILELEKVVRKKDKEIATLRNELDYLKGQILNKNRKMFGSSSEQSNTLQVSFFD